MRSRAALVLLIVACACSQSGPLSPAELNALNRAEAQWKARPFADYQYEIQVSCFCTPELNRWNRVSVRNGRVFEARDVATGAVVPAANLVWWQPIDSLFSSLRRAGDPGARDIYSDIVVEFDPVLGFPTHIGWVSKPNIADAGATYWLRNVQPLQASGIVR
jgi:uncharacterized protein DUF6174